MTAMTPEQIVEDLRQRYAPLVLIMVGRLLCPRRRGRPRVHEPDVIAAYAAGLTAAEIAAGHDIGDQTVRKVLKRNGLWRHEPTERERAIAAAYRGGQTLKEIGATYGLTREGVRQALKRLGVERRQAGGGIGRERKAALTQRNEKLVAAYRAGASVKDLAAEHDLHETTVYAALHKAGIKPRAPSKNAERTHAALELYRTGVPVPEIASRLGVARHVVYQTASRRKVRRYVSRD